MITVKSLLLILTCAVMFSGCDKQDSSGKDSVVFDSKIVDLSSDEQIIDIKARKTGWYMRDINVAESMDQRMDTIKGDWYTLMKKEGGEYLSVSVTSNEGEDRSIFIGISYDNVFSQIVVNQKGEI